MGTMLQGEALRPGENPAALNITRPETIAAIHRTYVEAGSQVVLTNTFGASRLKLQGTAYTPAQVIEAAVRTAKEAVGERARVALDIGPLGELLAPLGTLPFDAAYDLFYEQIAAGVSAGVDLIFIETMTDLQEVRAALLAARACTDLPVFVTMTFDRSGRTFTGVLPESFATVAQGLGADAVGLNCSTGPSEMRETVARLRRATDLPVIVKPNAGLPDPATGDYDMNPADFAEAVVELTGLGATILGGCCGTTPAYIEAVAGRVDVGIDPYVSERTRQSLVCSASQVVTIDGVRIIGERINPTGKPAFREALLSGNMDYILAAAIAQEAAGAEILDVNVGVPGLDEPQMMARVVSAIQSVTGLPLMLDSTNPNALEAGLRVYNGKAIVNSVNGEAAVLERILPLVKQYGAAVVGLTLDENGIPQTAAERVAIAGRILDAALAHGIPREDVFIDCLTLAVSAGEAGAGETLAALRTVREELGLQTVLGVSNISFGLPNRELVNQTFLALALEAGLTLPILNPNAEQMMDTVAAFRLLNGTDPEGAGFITKFAGQDPSVGAAHRAPRLPHSGTPGCASPTTTIDQAIARGLKEDAARITEGMLQDAGEHSSPLQIVNEHLIPALDAVGRRFEAGEIFLPQLLSAAGAAGAAFDVVKHNLTARGEAAPSKGPIILATVRGDIHDIGKNIVKVILENYGYRVIDLGRDVPVERIVEATLREDAKLVGLSALMTTTLQSMADTITALRERGHVCQVMVGGAVLTPEYAKEIGADYFARDARAGVEIAREVFGG
ncbi:MAG: homocysteine S-methyltransferase family protein [Oscillospiraceae bacterium]|nr:homocysteine S-methyltransferase family protein [Oscillospiraceae bacterium]